MDNKLINTEVKICQLIRKTLIELIKKEEDIKPEHIKDYVNVLDSKSKRLKVLIEDLFEASKASSGNLELNMEKIDITQFYLVNLKKNKIKPKIIKKTKPGK